MSIVLEALRRADRERRQASHADGLGEIVLQPADAPTTAPRTTAAAYHRWAWGVVAAIVAVAAIGAVAWSWRFGPHRPDPGVARSMPSASNATAATATSATSAASAVAMPRSQQSAGHASPAAAAGASVAAPAAHARAARDALPPLPAAQPRADRPVVSTPSPAPAREAAATGPVPERWRGRLAQWRFGGALDSTDAARRMVFIDGQLYREGDEPTPGLKLVRIRLRSALFEAEGRRFEWTY